MPEFENPNIIKDMQDGRFTIYKKGNIVLTALLFIFILHCNIYAQERDRVKTDSLLNERGEAYISIPNTNLKASRIVPEDIMFDKYTDTLSYFYINRKSFEQLEKTGLRYNYEIPPSLRGPVLMAKSANDVLKGNGYPTYDQYLQIMDSFRTSYPEICRIDTIGYSISGRLILSARLHSGDYLKGERPVMMYSSTMHGDEPVGYVLMLMLLDTMLVSYGITDDFTELIDSTIILINPLSNPDGTYYLGDTTIYGSIRENTAYADLNRDFPDCRQSQNYSYEGRQQETTVMMKYLEKYMPSISANFHGGAEVINYPWDRAWVNSRGEKIIKYHSDADWFISSCKEYVDSARNIHPDYMKTEFEAGYIMGAFWYDITGGRQDFITYFLRGREMSVELSIDKIPQPSELSYLWRINCIPLKNMLRRSLCGLYGEVRDSITGEPIYAKIFVPGHDSLNSFVYSDKRTGRFFRYLSPGTYDLSASAEGYITKIISGVEIEDYMKTKLDFQLKSYKSLLEEEDYKILQNPFLNKFTILFRSDKPEDMELLVYNINGKPVYSSVFVTSTGANQKTIHLSGYPPGLYILRLITNTRVKSFKLLKTD